MVFSDDNSSCKSLCESDSESNRKKRSDSGRKGWTYFISTDKPSGTGDHEHYFFYYGDNRRDRLAVYDSNGSKYTGCKKTAIDVRDRENHTSWWTLNKEYTLLFSELTGQNLTHNQYSRNPELQESHPEFKYWLKPDYG